MRIVVLGGPREVIVVVVGGNVVVLVTAFGRTVVVTSSTGGRYVLVVPQNRVTLVDVSVTVVGMVCVTV